MSAGADVAVVLGRAPSSASLLPAVLERLRADGHRVAVHVVGDGPPPASVAAADLVVLRALGLAALDALAPLEARGVRCCNTVAATRAARDKTLAGPLLARAGLPLPATAPAATWDEVRAVARGRAVVVKAAAGSRGKGILHTEDPPAQAPFPGPYVVEERVPHDGTDRKIFVAGGHVAGVLRPWPPRTLEDKRGRAFAVDGDLRELALAAGAALGLELYGADVVVGPDGPVLVDVNAFPGFKGVPEAPEWIAGHLCGLARTEAGVT